MQTPPEGHPVALLTGYVLETLEHPEHERVARHLAECTRCTAAANQLTTELFDPTGARPRPWVKWQVLHRARSSGDGGS